MKKVLSVLLMLLLPVTAICENFNTMKVIAHATNHTGGSPKHLAPYIQPLNMVATDGAIEVRLVDAFFMDGAIAAAWIVKNTGTVPLYVVDMLQIGGMQPSAYSHNNPIGIMQPGEVRECGIAGYLSDWMLSRPNGNEHKLTVHVAGLLLLGEPMFINDNSNIPDKSNFEALNREVNRLFDEEGKVVIDQQGYLMPGQGESTIQVDLKSGMPSAAQLLIQSGKLAPHSLASIDTSLKMNDAAHSIMSVKPIEVAIGGGTLRITCAELSPVRLIIEVAITFSDATSALEFYDASDQETRFPITVVDPRGVDCFFAKCNIGFWEDGFGPMFEPKRQEDGSYAWLFRSEHWYLAPISDKYYLLLNTKELPLTVDYSVDLEQDFSNAMLISNKGY